MSLKSTQELFVMAMKNDAKFEDFITLKSGEKFEEKLTCLGNDMRNMANFHLSTRKYQNWNFDEILWSKVENI